MKAPTEQQLRAMSPEQRSTVRSNAIKRGGDEAQTLLALLESLSLPYSSGGLSLDDPIYVEMQEIVWSKDGVAAALDAVKRGLPAMAGIDPLLQARMGERYRPEGQGTMNAGSLVAEMMRHQGYEVGPSAPLPAGCVAKSAATYQLKKPLR